MNIASRRPIIYTVDYLDGYQYESLKLLFFPTAEGYVKYTEGVRNPFDYVFNYTDHLGNVRLSYGVNPGTGILTKIEENNYYPFGLKHATYNNTAKMIAKVEDTAEVSVVSDKYMVQKTDPVAAELERPPMELPPGGIVTPEIYSGYNYKYNGKELQDELGLNWYDYSARNYDPALGRWMKMDPKAETSRRFSTYAYCLNNPVFFVDSDGMEAIENDDWKWEKDGSLTYDPFLTKDNASTRLKEGETYAGRTQTEVIPSSHGVDGYTLNYNSDGSISTSNPTSNNSSTIETTSEPTSLGSTELKLGDTVGDTSKLLMASAGVVALISAVTLQPEGLVLAGELLELGSGVGTVSSTIKATSYVSQKEYGEAGIEVAGLAVGKLNTVFVNQITNVTKETKTIGKAIGETIIDKVKESKRK